MNGGPASARANLCLRRPLTTLRGPLQATPQGVDSWASLPESRTESEGDTPGR
jgi:hypothetical protein